MNPHETRASGIQVVVMVAVVPLPICAPHPVVPHCLSLFPFPVVSCFPSLLCPLPASPSSLAPSIHLSSLCPPSTPHLVFVIPSPCVCHLVLSIVQRCGHPCCPLLLLVFIYTDCPRCPRLVLVPVLVVSLLLSPCLPHRPCLLVLVLLTVPWALAMLPVIVLHWCHPPPSPHLRCRHCLLLLFLFLFLFLVFIYSVLPHCCPLPSIHVWVVVVFLSHCGAVWRSGAVSGGGRWVVVGAYLVSAALFPFPIGWHLCFLGLICGLICHCSVVCLPFLGAIVCRPCGFHCYMWAILSSLCCSNIKPKLMKKYVSKYASFWACVSCRVGCL